MLRLGRPLAVKVHLSINYVCHVAALAQKLDRLLARACHLRPPGFCLRVLFKPPHLVSVEHEVHLPQTSFGGPPDGITFFPKLDDLSVLDEGLSPDLDQSLLEGTSGSRCGRATVNLSHSRAMIQRKIAPTDGPVFGS